MAKDKRKITAQPKQTQSKAPQNTDLLASFEQLEAQRQREWLFRRHRERRTGWHKD